MKALHVLLSRLARRDDTGQGSTSTRPAGGTSTLGGGSTSRKQLLSVVLRETLLRNGIPVAWIGVQYLRTVDRAKPQPSGIHVRLVVQQWHPDLPPCMIAIERDFLRRVALVDYRCSDWLQGVSWQFRLPDDLECPPLPRPGAWTADPPAAAPADREAVPSEHGKVIEGPLRLSPSLADDDVGMRAHAPTVPAPLAAQS